MSARGYKVFLFTLCLCGYFPFRNPLDLNVKKGSRIRGTLALAWSLFLIIYPTLFFLDMMFSLPVLPSAGSNRQSATIPWYACLASQFVINASLRLFSILNCGKLVELVENLRPLKVQTEQTSTGGLRKWTCNRLVWVVYAGQFTGQAFRLVLDLTTDESAMNGLKLLFVPEPAPFRIFTCHLVYIIMVSCVLVPCNFIITLGSDLVQVHGSICAEVAELLVEQPIVEVRTNTAMTIEPRMSKTHMRVARIQEKFTTLKECFKIYERLAGFYCFCIFWWVFAVIVTSFSSVSSPDSTNGLTRIDTINYGAWSILFIYMVASFGEFMASSIEQGREAISDAMGRLGECRMLEDKEQVMTVNY